MVFINFLKTKTPLPLPLPSQPHTRTPTPPHPHNYTKTHTYIHTEINEVAEESDDWGFWAGWVVAIAQTVGGGGKRR